MAAQPYGCCSACLENGISKRIWRLLVETDLSFLADVVWPCLVCSVSGDDMISRSLSYQYVVVSGCLLLLVPSFFPMNPDEHQTDPSDVDDANSVSRVDVQDILSGMLSSFSY